MIAAIPLLTGQIIALYQNKNLKNTVGPKAEEDKTVLKILEEIQEFQTYQHTRNHDIINNLSKIVLFCHEILRILGHEHSWNPTTTQIEEEGGSHGHSGPDH